MGKGSRKIHYTELDCCYRKGGRGVGNIHPTGWEFCNKVGVETHYKKWNQEAWQMNNFHSHTQTTD